MIGDRGSEARGRAASWSARFMAWRSRCAGGTAPEMSVAYETARPVAALALSSDRSSPSRRHIADALRGSGYRADSVIADSQRSRYGRNRCNARRDDVRRDARHRRAARSSSGPLAGSARSRRRTFCFARRRPSCTVDPRFHVPSWSATDRCRSALCASSQLGSARPACLFAGRRRRRSRPDRGDGHVRAAVTARRPADGAPRGDGARTPVVATAVGGVPEVVERNGSTACWSSAATIARLAGACLTLGADRLSRANARRAGQDGPSSEHSRRDERPARSCSAYRSRRDRICGPPRAVERTLAARPGPHAAVVLGTRHPARQAGTGDRPRAGAWRRLRRSVTCWTRSRFGNTDLILCQGNIIRSPFAASLVAQALSANGRSRVVSGGVVAKAGRPPHPGALELATRAAVDLSGHAASPVSRGAGRRERRRSS